MLKRWHAEVSGFVLGLAFFGLLDSFRHADRLATFLWAFVGLATLIEMRRRGPCGDVHGLTPDPPPPA